MSTERNTTNNENNKKHSIPEIPSPLPLLPVRGVVVFPGTVVPLMIGRDKSKRLIDEVLRGKKLLGVFAQRHDEVEDPGIEDIYRVGTVAQVLKLLRAPDGTNSLLVHGIVRAGLEEIVETDPYWKAVVHQHVDTSQTNLQLEALVYSARRTAEQVIEHSPNIPEEARQILAGIEDPSPLADFLAANLSLGLVQKQELLETFDVEDRLRKINATLQNQLDVLSLSHKIQSEVREQIDRSQREYYLQEQMKAIRRELGEDDPAVAELDALRERINEAEMPPPVRKEADRELKRLERLPQASPERGMIRDYIDWLVAMPWTRQTTDVLDIDRAAAVLDEDHYGLKKIKQRILEALAVKKLNPEGKSPILCFVGPPGVGKTSLGQSIARAMGREFIRVALGGVRDEADIRGHRRTYLGAIPGRIVQELRKARVRNPVFMLDEVDKLGADFRGDPAAALLEVLDPAQNHSFTDHYLGVPLDLSNVLFIGTANYMDPVEPALRDRMEIIELPGYTTLEKLEIAKRYLVPRQLKQHGLTPENLSITDDAIRHIADAYTREAGVRNLERNIAAVCRGVAVNVARDPAFSRTVTVENVDDYLGARRYEAEVAERTSMPGVVTGLAYTPFGGAIMFIEAALMPGRGNVAVTGQIGDVMRESAQAALSLIRARGKSWGLDLEGLPNHDIHMHMPAGAIPKDGPSAGVALLTALFTLLTNTTVDKNVAMTGEITLRGQVLPVGGIREKVMAAHRAGLKRIIIPKRNQRDLHEVPDEVRSDLEFILVQHVEDVLAAAIPGVEVEDDRATAKKRKQPAKPRTAKKATKRPTTKRASARKNSQAPPNPAAAKTKASDKKSRKRRNAPKSKPRARAARDR